MTEPVREIEATRRVGQSPERVDEFLSDLRNHWRLSDRFLELEALDGDASGGRVRLKGPLGLGRTARTRVEESRPGLVRGRADVGRGTVGRVQWEVSQAPGGSAVTLSARVERASALDRWILALGGQRWLRAVFRRALENLEKVLKAD
jgi:hypothetical protein